MTPFNKHELSAITDPPFPNQRLVRDMILPYLSNGMRINWHPHLSKRFNLPRPRNLMFSGTSPPTFLVQDRPGRS